MHGDLSVDLDDLGRAGPRLSTLAARLADDPAAGPALAGTAPGWATTAALEALRARAVAWAHELADGVHRSADALTATVEAYADADDRAATRLHGTR